MLRRAPPLRRGAAVLSGLWRLGPHSYGLHAIYLLTCFITAHEEAQEEMHWMYGERQARLHQEEVQIVGESRVAVKRARDYLADLSKIVINGEQLGEVIDGVRARQLGALLIHRIAGFAEQMYEHGLLDQRSVHRLVEQLEHDQIHLPNRVAEEAAAAAGGAGGGGAAAAAQLGYSHEEMRRGLRELEIVQRKHQVALERMLQMGRSRESLDGLDDGTSEASGTTALFSVAAAAASAVGRCRPAQAAGRVVVSARQPTPLWLQLTCPNVGSPTHVRLQRGRRWRRVTKAAAATVRLHRPMAPSTRLRRAASRARKRKRSIVGVAHQAITDAASQAAQKALPSVKYKPGEDKSDFMQLDLGHFAAPPRQVEEALLLDRPALLARPSVSPRLRHRRRLRRRRHHRQSALMRTPRPMGGAPPRPKGQLPSPPHSSSRRRRHSRRRQLASHRTRRPMVGHILPSGGRTYSHSWRRTLRPALQRRWRSAWMRN